MKKQATQAIMQAVIDRAVKTLVPPKTTKQTKQNPKRKRKNKRNKIDNNGLVIRSSPASYSSMITTKSSSFSNAGLPDAHADYDRRHGIKLTGACLFGSNIAGGTAQIGAFTGVYWSALSPLALGGKAAAVASIYSFYAFRQARIHYVPWAPTSSSIAVAIGISESFSETQSITTPTLRQLLDEQTSVLTAVYNPAMIVCDCRGSRLFHAQASSLGVGDDSYQLMIGAAFSSAVTGTIYGSLYIEYELDLYSPGIAHSVTLSSSSKNELRDDEQEHELHEYNSLRISEPLSVSNKSPLSTFSGLPRR